MSMAEAEHIDLEFNGLSLIDDALDNGDFSLSLSPSPIKPSENHKNVSFDLSGTMDVHEEKDMDCAGEQDDILPELHKSTEPERTKRKGKLNLRKSLAWDSAFFTDAGVLDAEELSSMVSGAEKVEKNTMPSIDEDVERSTDTISTLESDNVALEHLEAELFEDIRASIQRSSKVSNAMTSTGKEVSSKADNGAISASKKADATIKHVPKPKLAPRRNIGTQNSVTLKSQQKRADGMQGSRKGVQQESPHITQSVVKSGDSTSSFSKLPKPISKPNPMSATMAKRASLSASHVKTGHDNPKTNTVAGKGAQIPKVSDSINASKVLPKPTLSSKPSSTRFPPASRMQSSRSSSESTLSDKAGKSTLPVARRKVATTKPVSQPSSGSVHKTPSKSASKNKVSSGNSAISAYLMSSKINSNISPASSISEWSSVSAASSSCSVINERSNKLRISFDTSSCRSLESDTPSLDSSNCSSNQISEKPSPKEKIRKASMQSNTSSIPTAKPSGLRMPSPKIGFFDGVKSARTPNGKSTALPKIGASTPCSPSGRSNMKSKTPELPSSRMGTATVNVKSGTKKVSSPKTSLDKSPAAASFNATDGTKDSSPKTSLDKSPAAASFNATDDAPGDIQRVHSVTPEIHQENEEYAMDAGSLGVPDATKHVVDAGLEAVPKNDMTAINEKANSNDIKVIAVEEEISDSVSKNIDTTISALAASRTPFADMNSGNGDTLEFPKESFVGNVNSAPLEIDHKENKSL